LGIAVIVAIVILISACSSHSEYDYSFKKLGYINLHGKEVVEQYYENLLELE